MDIRAWAEEQIGNFGRGYVKGQIRAHTGRYLLALQDGGMGYNELRYLVEHDASYYQEFMPPSWKQELMQLVQHAIADGNAKLEDLRAITSDDMGDFLPLFMEAVAEDFPWFVEAVSEDKKAWMIKEVSLFLHDLETQPIRASAAQG